MIAELLSGRSIRDWRAALPAFVLALYGCTGDTQDTPIENWRDLQIHVESRSYSPMPGMRELLVFVNRNRVLPAWDCRVELRTSDADPWKQAIEDGRVGVYRRAAKVDEREHSVLQIWIRAEGSETVLRIPLKSQPAASAAARDPMVSATLTK
jgi:hypothetical protein